MSTQIPSTDPKDLIVAAKCFESCVTERLGQSIKTHLLDQVAVIVTNPVCVPPTAPILKGLTRSDDPQFAGMLQASWNQLSNTGGFITGYIVFWGTTNGGPYPFNSGVLPPIPRIYLITGLTPGTTYYVVVQAITALAGCTSVNSNQLSNSPGGTPGTPAAVTAWEARVIANGGADPVGSVPAATIWYNALVAAGIDTLMKDVNFFAPDSLIASLTPFFVTSTANLWTVTNPPGVISNAGLSCGVTQLVDAGGAFPSYYTTSTGGLTWYGRQPGGNAMGAAQFGVGTGALALMFEYTNFAISYQNPANQINQANPFALDEYGFMTLNRTGLNQFDAYRANGNVPFASGGTNAAASGSPPAGGTLKCGSQAGLGFFYNFSATYIHSFFAAHLGLTSVQAQALFNATQALRQAFGGGFT